MCQNCFKFQDVLTSDESGKKSPIIFLRDVTFQELQSLIQFIYFGKTTIQGKDSSVDNVMGWLGTQAGRYDQKYAPNQ